MTHAKTAANLIAAAIQERLLQGVRFGLLAQSLPPFDPHALFTALLSTEAELRLALLGFEGMDTPLPMEIAQDVETVVGWRNDPAVTARLVVILNPVSHVEKIHSLAVLDPFTDRDLRQAIYRLGEKEALDAGYYLTRSVWVALRELEMAESPGFYLVASQLASFYYALQTQEVGDALVWLGLLPDRLLSAPDKVHDALQRNHDTVEWLSALGSEDFRTLARALSDEDVGFRETFRKIRAYANSPTRESLQALTLDEVQRLRTAPKTPRMRNTTHPADVPSNLHLVEQLIRAASEQNPKERQEIFQYLEDQAGRVSQLFSHDDIPEDCLDERPDIDEDASDDFVSLQDYWTKEEVGRIERPKGDQRHPLEEWFHKWLRFRCWGGQIQAEVTEVDDVDPPSLFANRTPLHFQPLRPLDNDDSNSLLCLLGNLDQVTRQSGISSQLVSLLYELAEHRRFLIRYQDLFLYHPQYALHDSEIRQHLETYLAAYRALGEHLQRTSRQLQERYPDAIQRAIAQFLALDSVLIRLNATHQPDQTSRVSVLLTSLHPLHLWKWLQLNKYLVGLSQPLTKKEQVRICLATKYLPTLLNTFVVHPIMYGEPADEPETRLVLAGEIGDPENGREIGIPYYRPVGYQAAGVDGVTSFSSFLRRFLVLYPPSQLGLTLVIIDPPDLSAILHELVDLHRSSERSVHLEGSRLFVFWTKPATYDEWQSRDEEALQLFRENPRWMLYIDLESRSLEKVHQELRKREIYPHIILLCDPSKAVARSIFRTVQDEATPFSLPIQLTYDQISDTVQIVPAPTGDIFDVYAGLRHILTGDLHRTILGVGSRGAKAEDLRRFLDTHPGTHWLAILDWPQGTLEIPSDLGRRLLYLPAGSRTLSIHTGKKDWEEYWQQKLQLKLDEWHLPANAAIVLSPLLELAPLLPNGLLSLVRQSPQDFVDILDDNSLAEMMGVLAVLRWYRRQYPGAVLVPSGGEDFDDWYGTADFQNQRPPYHMALWIENGRLKCDVLAVHTIIPALKLKAAGDEVAHLATFARSLHLLFDESAGRFVLTALRRAVFRERLLSTVFAASEVSGSPLLQSRQTKAQWARALNEFFDPVHRPFCRLLQISVILDEKGEEVAIQKIAGGGLDGFESYAVTIPGSLLYLDPLTAAITDQPVSAPPSLPVSTALEELPAKQPVAQPSLAPGYDQDSVIRRQAEQLHRVLDAYGLSVARVNQEKSQIGPRFIRYWVQLVPPAGRLSEVQKYAEDIAREMGSRSVPFIDNIPGERYIGIDLARDEPVTVPLEPALEKLPSSQPDRLLIAAGQNPAGENVWLDLVRLPHMLIAGQTGSGKTVFLSTLISSIVWRHSPDDVQLLLIDPKQTDFGVFGALPHLVDKRILYEPDEAIEALRNLLEVERPRRIELVQQAKCPNNLEYNRRNPTDRISWLVVIVDEFADLVLSLSRNEREKFEKQINRLAATGRSVGIHLVIATQRPTTDIITGTIKANITARVSFRLPSQIDSRTILDRPGAENLLGQGDMLVSINNNVQRLQGYYASYDEFRQLVATLRR